MIFEMKKWRSMYEEAHRLGITLSELEKLGVLTDAARESIKDHLNFVLTESSAYLLKCGLNFPRPLWDYNRDDETTWASSPNFAYAGRISDKG